MKRSVSKLMPLLLLAGVTLGAREVTSQELQMYAAEVYRVQYSDLKEEDQKKVQKEYQTKLDLGDAILDKMKTDPLFSAAIRFKAIDIWSRMVAEKADVSEKVLRDLFVKQPIKVPPLYKVRNILVQDDTAADQIVAELNKLQGDALQKRFVDLVAEKSIDKMTNSRQGDSGWMDLMAMPKPIAEKLQNAQKGAVAKLQPMPGVGTHILYVEDIKPEHPATFEEAKQYLTNLAIGMKIDEEAKKLLEPKKTVKKGSK